MLPLAPRRAVTAVLLAAMLGLGLLAVGSAASPSPAFAVGPLPPCAYDDVRTTPRDYDDWSTTLVDTTFRVPASYVPPDLTPVSAAGIAGTGQVRALVIDDLAAMAEAATAAGTPIAVQSAYRSYATQITTFQYWVDRDGYDAALVFSARPGHSEHQLGVAIDFRSADGGPPWSGSDWGLSPAGHWMRLNAWKYGFILSYPKGKRAVTCYEYESWHYRYVGRAEAAAIHASGLTIRQYLWSHYTTSTMPPATPTATAAPSAMPSTAPSEAPSAAPSEAPSAAPTSPPTASPSSTERPRATSAPLVPRPPAAIPEEAGIAFLGMDVGTTAVAGGLVVLVVLLLGSIGMAFRRHGRSGPS